MPAQSYNDELKQTPPSDVAAAVLAGQAIGDVRYYDRGDGVRMPVIVSPAGSTLHTLPNPAADPAKKRGTVTLFTAQSFTDYVNRFKDADSLVFIDQQLTSFTAVLDYHRQGEGTARARQHRAVFTCRATEDWKRWSGGNKKVFNQADFAQFLEDNLQNIADPAGTVILGLATNLSVRKDVAFRSATRLSDGQTQLLYEETVEASKGDMKLPDRFVLGLEPFEGAGAYKVEARLRYRIAEGKLALWYDLLRPDKVLEAAFGEVLVAVQTSLSDTAMVHGQIGRSDE